MNLGMMQKHNSYQVTPHRGNGRDGSWVQLLVHRGMNATG